MSDYHNDFKPDAILPNERAEQEVSLPLREVVRLYVVEAIGKRDAELSTVRAELDEMRGRWLDEYNKRENAEAECRRLNAVIDEREVN